MLRRLFCNGLAVGFRPRRSRTVLRWVSKGSLLVAAASVAGWGWAQDDVVRSVDPETGLVAWRLQTDELAVDVIQRLPAQTRGFFEARGFTAEMAARIADECVMQMIVRNSSVHRASWARTVRLADWRVRRAGDVRPLLLADQWLASWGASDVGAAARLAFRWSLFPAVQTFAAGDYGWGMIALGVPPGSVVTLDISWSGVDGDRRARIADLECAPER